MKNWKTGKIITKISVMIPNSYSYCVQKYI